MIIEKAKMCQTVEDECEIKRLLKQGASGFWEFGSVLLNSFYSTVYSSVHQRIFMLTEMPLTQYSFYFNGLRQYCVVYVQKLIYVTPCVKPLHGSAWVD